ncbi:hypothetical protein LH935_28390 (plasmid) [Gordonia polyisoprenivorans]|uniref:hypothetical protein n=1 Tax=Gordonia polyisoprenivorans TaxID=84595 RepID=UPI0022346E58|nr:hypothetical protein LH935_28390 [Gordonia polyisoprenivorans]
MTTRTAERANFLTDVYTTALEGGIGYWSECSAYQWSTTQRAVITDLNEAEHTITLDTIARGVNAIIDGRTPITTAMRRQIAAASRANEAIDLDSDHADAIVQAGLYGSITWG